MKWECFYLVIYGDDTFKKMDELGEQGWELVSVTSENEYQSCTAYFKRRLEENDKKSD